MRLGWAQATDRLSPKFTDSIAMGEEEVELRVLRVAAHFGDEKGPVLGEVIRGEAQLVEQWADVQLGGPVMEDLAEDERPVALKGAAGPGQHLVFGALGVDLDPDPWGDWVSETRSASDRAQGRRR